MLRSQKIEDREAFTALREEWNELLEDSDAATIFLTWEWLLTWWQHLALDRKPEIFLVRKGGRLIGAAPLALRPSRYMRLMPFPAMEFLGTGSVGSDYLSVVVRKDFEHEALAAISAELEQRNQVLQLSYVEKGSSTMDAFARQLLKRGWKLTCMPVELSPYTDLRGQNWNDFVQGLGRSHRSNLRRRLRQLDRSFEVTLEQAQSDSQRSQFLQELVRLHLQRWAERGGSNALHTSALLDFHEDFSRLALGQGWLRLYLLRLDGEPTAAFYCMSYGKKFYYYQAGFDPRYSSYSVGLAGVGLVIRKAIEEGAEEFDFLRGDEQYKYLWATGERELVRYELFLPHLRGSIYKQSMRAREELKRAVNYCRQFKLGEQRI